MNIGIYDPYLDTLGGGERYCFDIASCLSAPHEVSIFWDDPDILSKAQARFHIPVGNIHLVKNVWKSGSIVERIYASKKYDVLFYVSDGSIPWLFSRKAYIIFQFPVPWIGGGDLLTKLKLRRVNSLLCYSEFVSEHLKKVFTTNVRVLTPSIDSGAFVPGRKKRVILSVGRFTTGMNTKKQHILIEAFKLLHKNQLNDWQLVLTGGLLPQDRPFVESLKEQARGYPIEIIPNAAFEKLQALYKVASIYWHAAGFGENLDTHPEHAEHFGLSTIEAMSAGVVPVVFDGGGQKEIVRNGVNGFVWTTTQELIDHTVHLAQNTKLWTQISQASVRRASDFSREHFCSELISLL